MPPSRPPQRDRPTRPPSALRRNTITARPPSTQANQPSPIDASSVRDSLYLQRKGSAPEMSSSTQSVHSPPKKKKNKLQKPPKPSSVTKASKSTKREENEVKPSVLVQPPSEIPALQANIIRNSINVTKDREKGGGVQQAMAEVSNIFNQTMLSPFTP